LAKVYRSHAYFYKHMPVFPGDTPSSLEKVKTFSDGGYLVTRFSSGMHVGTHIDSPAHFIENGKMICEFPLDKFYGAGVLIDARGDASVKKVIDESVLENIKIPKNSIVLVLTGHDKKFRDKDYYETYPVVTESFANKLIELGVSIVGFDSPSPDRAPFNIHKILFKKDILIIENLKDVHKLLDEKHFDVCAFPLKIDAEGSFVRVVAMAKE